MNLSTPVFILFLLIYQSAQSQILDFKNLADMPTARGAITSATDDHYFYVSNGFSVNSKYTGIIEKYDIEKDKWNVLTTSLIPKQFPSSAIIGNNLYVFNGDLADKTLNKKTEVVDVKTGKITFAADNPQPAHAAGTAVWKNNIYVFGGKISPDSSIYSNKLFRYDPSDGTWTMLASMFEAKETKGIIVDGKLYLIGGYNGKPSDRIEMYDIETDTWKELSRLPFGISANSIAAHGSKIYTLFDYTKQTLIGCYDIASGKFTILDQNNVTARRHAGVHIVKNKLYIMGGNTSIALNSCLSSLQVADLKDE